MEKPTDQYEFDLYKLSEEQISDLTDELPSYWDEIQAIIRPPTYTTKKIVRKFGIKIFTESESSQPFGITTYITPVGGLDLQCQSENLFYLLTGDNEFLPYEITIEYRPQKQKSLIHANFVLKTVSNYFRRGWVGTVEGKLHTKEQNTDRPVNVMSSFKLTTRDQINNLNRANLRLIYYEPYGSFNQIESIYTACVSKFGLRMKDY
jgi:hypothetical protein